ncbi:MAG: hypothetical protein GC200_00810 [Tepidisphaera sp.]|nr:hypothetical protein [Tepidisphaera sp.]
MPRRIAYIFAFVMLCLFPRLLRSQCGGEWLPGHGVSGVNGSVLTTLPMPDGSVIVGGQWEGIGDLPTKNICRVLPDGNIEPLGDGLARYVSALALAPDGTILAGGLGNTTQNCIWRFDPASLQWSPIGGGFFTYITVIRAIAALPNGDIIIGGDFSSQTAPIYHNLARYTASTGEWTPIPLGVYGDDNLYNVLTLLQIDEDRVLVGGDLTRAGGLPARGFATLHLSDNTLTVDPPLAGGSDRISSMLKGSDGTIYIGGSFLDPQSGAVIPDLRTYDPDEHSWVSITPGMVGGFTSLTELADGSIAATGATTFVDGVSCGGSARYNPATHAWSNLGGVIRYQSLTGLGRAIAPFGEHQVLIGGVIDYAGSRAAKNLITVDLATNDTRPVVEVTDGAVRTLLDLPEGDLAVGGSFTHLEGIELNGIGIHHPDGSWTTLGSGVTQDVASSVNACVRLADGRLLVGGFFASAGGVTGSRNLAIVNPQAGAWLGTNALPNGAITCLLNSPDGRVIVGGGFTSIGGIIAGGVVVFDPANNTWQPLPPTSGNRSTQALAWLSDHRLLVGGGLSIAGQTAAFLSAYDFTSHAWTDFSPNANGYIRSLLVLPGDDVVVGGTFTSIRGMSTRSIIHFFVPLQQWTPFSQSFTSGGPNTGVYSLALRPCGDILAGGKFTDTGPSTPTLYGIALLTPGQTTWRPLMGGLYDPYASSTSTTFAILARGNDEILAGGDFSFADTQLSASLAHWVDTCPPDCNPDLNADGCVDQGDVDYLINVIAGGANPTNIDPDFNHDGVADQGDVDALVSVIAGGPCP